MTDPWPLRIVLALIVASPIIIYWRAALAKKYGTENAPTDPALQALVKKIIDTGAEYEKTEGSARTGGVDYRITILVFFFRFFGCA